MTKLTYTASKLCGMIAVRHPFPEWVTCFEVSNGTGGNARRRADAVAMNTWPSRGHAIHGFEVKVSRSDWKSEMLQPEKAEAVAQYCDYWWLVAPEDIVVAGELPLPWGHLAPRGDHLHVVKAAERLTAKPVTRDFMASFIRNAAKADAVADDAKVQALVAAERAQLNERIKQEVTHRTKANAAARAALEEIAGMIGIEPTAWARQQDTIDAMKVVAKMKAYGLEQQIAEAGRGAALVAKFAEAFIKKPTGANASAEVLAALDAALGVEDLPPPGTP